MSGHRKTKSCACFLYAFAAMIPSEENIRPGSSFACANSYAYIAGLITIIMNYACVRNYHTSLVEPKLLWLMH